MPFETLRRKKKKKKKMMTHLSQNDAICCHIVYNGDLIGQWLMDGGSNWKFILSDDPIENHANL
jgi:hypothetical protein